jgi:hypothetical protein
MFALLVFVFTRYLLFFKIGAYVTDVVFYHDTAIQAVLEHAVAYRDFGFPYPPLSLLFIYTPVFFSADPIGYRYFFRLEMLLVDGGAFFALFLLLRRRLSNSSLNTNITLSLYSVFGVFVGHLLYDRLDVVLSLDLLLIAFLWTGSNRQKKWAYVATLLGTAFKVVPIFLVPIFLILNEGKSLRQKLEPVYFILIPAALGGFVLNLFTSGGFFHSMLDHGLRGIQVESLWATPLLWHKILVRNSPYFMDYSYLAFHVGGVSPNGFYLFLSKYLGFVLLLVFYTALYGAASKSRIRAYSPYQKILSLYSVIVILMTFQRVLSPQFFIWLLPAIFILMSRSFKGLLLLLLSLLIYGMTYVEFDVGFHAILDFSRFHVACLTLRNIALLVFCGIFVRTTFRSFERTT